MRKKSVKLRVKKDVEYRGMRAAWYDLIQKCDGKDLDTFFSVAERQAPNDERPRGWLRFFIREGVVTLR